MMQTRLKCEKPDDIEFTVTITMTAKEWEKLRDQLDTMEKVASYPSNRLVYQITDLLAQARKIYWANEEPKS